jgi:hypothetical protein
MAEFAIVVVPRDPHYVPSPSAVLDAEALMADFFPDRGDEVRQDTSDTPKLITTRSAFDSVKCPRCSETVERFELDEDDDGTTWWDRFEEKVGLSLDPMTELIEMPCCEAEVKAGEIDLGDGAAFSRFTLSLRDPGNDPSVSSEQRSALERALSCPVRTMTRVDD